MSITKRRKTEFCRRVLVNANLKIGFADIGSGGPLKSPWNVIPDGWIDTHNFEPTDGDSDVSRCISNTNKRSKFFIAGDERSSSLHEPSGAFLRRFDGHDLKTKEVREVEVTTLDDLFKGKYDCIDAMDINAEGHDHQVLQGAQSLLSESLVKLIKVEYELTEVWQGQGWFSDIDSFLRGNGFELADIETEYQRPLKVKRIFHKGEPLWGKAYYVPSLQKWKSIVENNENNSGHVLKAVALYVAADMPGRAVDLVDASMDWLPKAKDELAGIRRQIFRTYRFAMCDALWKKLSGVVEGCKRNLSALV